jgi:hypothetical protein
LRVGFEWLEGGDGLVGVAAPEGVGVGEERETYFLGVEVCDEEGEQGFDCFGYLGIESRLHFVYKNTVTFL